LDILVAQTAASDRTEQVKADSEVSDHLQQLEASEQSSIVFKVVDVESCGLKDVRNNVECEPEYRSSPGRTWPRGHGVPGYERQMANAFGNLEGAPDAGVDEGLWKLLW